MTEEQQTPYEIFILGLCIYVLIEMALESWLTLSTTTLTILGHIDDIICYIFIADFFIQLFQAKQKIGYLKWGWIDLISSLPMLDSLRIGRTFRLLRILRLLRGLYVTKRLIKHLLRHKAETSVSAAAMVSFILILFTSIGIVELETDTQSNIKTAEDALWWAFVTITTVGYGDKFPITLEGRILAAGLITAGVGLFGTFTGFIASWFLTNDEQVTESELELLRVELSEIKQLLRSTYPEHSNSDANQV